MRDIAELKGPGNAPKHPGEGASEKELEKYQSDLTKFNKEVQDFNNKLSSLNQKLDTAQTKLARAQNKLQKLQGPEMSQAQNQDARELQKWTDDTRKALESKAEALADSTQQDKDLYQDKADAKIELKVVQIKREVKLEDGSTFEFKVFQLEAQVGDEAIQASSVEPTITDMPKPPATGII